MFFECCSWRGVLVILVGTLLRLLMATVELSSSYLVFSQDSLASD